MNKCMFVKNTWFVFIIRYDTNYTLVFALGNKLKTSRIKITATITRTIIILTKRPTNPLASQPTSPSDSVNNMESFSFFVAFFCIVLY